MSSPDSVNGEKHANGEIPEHSETFVHPSLRKSYDPNVTLEEYMHYAKITREQEEAEYKSPTSDKTGLLQTVLGRGPRPPPAPEARTKPPTYEKDSEETNARRDSRRASKFGVVVTNDEWVNASRAFRTASWGAGFYLITTDILGGYCLFPVTSLSRLTY